MTIMKNNWIDKLKEQGACKESLVWASEYESPQAAWDACEEGDWMLSLWANYCGKNGSDSHRKLVLACIECARIDMQFKNSDNLLNLIERWAKKESGITLSKVVDECANFSNSQSYPLVTFYSIYQTAISWTPFDWTSAGYDVCYFGKDSFAKKVSQSVPVGAFKECADIIRKIQPDCPMG